MRGDLHQALKTESVGQQATKEVDLKIVRLQHGKKDTELTLHARPMQIWSAGVQVDDALALCGFRASDECVYFHDRCFVRSISDDFSLPNFASAFSSAFAALREAQNRLADCGLSWIRGHRSRGSGDGHAAQKIEKLKERENEHFRFVLTWLEGAAKGWTTHYIPKHPPLSPELAAVMSFLGVSHFPNCPDHDFEPCQWRHVPFEKRAGNFTESNADIAHAWFEAHAELFSVGAERLLAANRDVTPFGMAFLSISSPAPVASPRSRPGAPGAKPTPTIHGIPDHFDVALSFAGSERGHAEQLAKKVRAAGFEVFFDDFYPEHLWGKNLVDMFSEIYRKRARFCVIFVSKSYIDRAWTNHERQNAQARALEEKGKEYILPVQVDGSELPGVAPTVGYLSLTSHTIDTIADLLVRKLRT